MLENFLHGRRKHVWISVGNDLALDARRDLDDLGCGNGALGDSDNAFSTDSSSFSADEIPSESNDEGGSDDEFDEEGLWESCDNDKRKEENASLEKPEGEESAIGARRRARAAARSARTGCEGPGEAGEGEGKKVSRKGEGSW